MVLFKGTVGFYHDLKQSALFSNFYKQEALFKRLQRLLSHGVRGKLSASISSNRADFAIFRAFLVSLVFSLNCLK